MKLEPISLTILKGDAVEGDDYNEDIPDQGNHYQLRGLLVRSLESAHLS